MDIRATSHFVRVSPRKVRLIADAMRKLTVGEALAQLQFIEKRAAAPLSKTLKSCIANAIHNAKVKQEDLVIKAITVDEGPAFKRWQPVSRGMAHAYKKRTSHINVVLTTRLGVGQAVEKKPVVKKAMKGVTRGTKSKS